MKRLLTVLITIALLAFSSITLVYSRAGGGEDYGGGGFDSGSSFEDSDYIGGSFVPTSISGGGGRGMLGTVICCLIILAIVVFTIARKKGWIKPPQAPITPSPFFTSGITGPEVQPDLAERKKKLEESDPAWNEQRFLDTAETIFFKVQEAWTKKKLEIARPFISDSIYTRFSQQIKDLSDRGLRNVLENIVIGSSEIVKIEQDNEFDSITVKFRASMKDYKIDEKTGKVVSGSKEQSPPFTEYWTFIRKAGTKTKETPVVKEKKCPNCGAPLEINESGVCKYCGANVVSGDFDWVLSKITQKEEWHA